MGTGHSSKKRLKMLNETFPYSEFNKIELDFIKIIEIIKKEKHKKSKIRQSSLIYSQRSNIISSLINYNNVYKYQNKVFYLGLAYLDEILKSIDINNLNQKKLQLYIINSIILAAKFYEDDILSLNIDRFVECEENEYDINSDDILLNEVKCLKILNYEINFCSLYDLLILLRFLLFDEFLNDFDKDYDGEFYQLIYDYPFEVLGQIIYSPEILFNYTTFEIDICILYHTYREIKFSKKYINRVLQKLDVNFNNYKTCLDTINYFLTYNK